MIRAPFAAVVVATKLAHVSWHLARGLWIVKRTFPNLTTVQQHAHVQAWAGEMLRVFGIELRVSGQLAEGGSTLLVANHISWLDIVVLHAAGYCRFVSKSDVKAWPVVGTLATAAGTLYIERESRRDAMRVVHNMADSLRNGDVVAVFPEGTTGDGVTVLPFHANLIQAAISAEAEVQPVALRFVDQRTGETSFAPSYVGDETLLGSIWRTLSANVIAAEVNYGAVQRAEGRDRRTWAADLRNDVNHLRTAQSTPASL